MSARDLEQILVRPSAAIDEPPATRLRVDRLVIGRLVALGAGGVPLVVFDGQPGSAALTARATVDIASQDIGREVTILCEEADPWRPIITGLLRPALSPDVSRLRPMHVSADGERLLLDAQREIVLRCGKASITLTSAGKVIIRGTYLSSQSSGVNRIKGGSVELN